MPSPDAAQVAAVVLGHPAVAGLHGGPFGAIATYLPGRHLVGVRIGPAGEPVEVGVVLRLGAPIPDVVRALRAAVSPLCAGTAVDIAVMDVVLDEPPTIDQRRHGESAGALP